MNEWEGFSTADEGRKRVFEMEGEAFVKSWRMESL